MAGLKLQITLKMMKEIDKALQNLPERYQHLKGSYADIARMNAQQYKWYVGEEPWLHEEDSFLNENGDMCFKVLMIEYAPELYACPRYLTTQDLKRIANEKADGRKSITIEEFMSALIDEINI